jgi:hypothetical protein
MKRMLVFQSGVVIEMSGVSECAYSPEGIEHKSELRKILLDGEDNWIGMGSNQIRLRDTRYLMAYLYT